jgi:hypothetical protein
MNATQIDFWTKFQKWQKSPFCTFSLEILKLPKNGILGGNKKM